MLPKISVAQIGARMHYAVPRILEGRGMLEFFLTDICASRGLGKLASLLPENALPAGIRQLAGRRVTGVSPAKIVTSDYVGLKKAFYYRRRSNYSDFQAINLQHVKSWCESVASKRPACSTHIYAFNSCALEIFTSPNWQAKQKILEQTIAPLEIERSILKRASDLYPGFSWKDEGDIPSFRDACRRERSEWEIADKIICGSEFVKQSIGDVGGPKEKCIVVPYGFGTLRESLEFRSPATSKIKLNVLFVGIVGLRKGAPVLLEVAKRCSEFASIRIVGKLDCPDSFVNEINRYCDVVGVVPRQEMRHQYAWADLFLLPSLCEGSATVTYEAVNSGLPVICTPNTGSTIADGVSGYIVPPFLSDPIVERVQTLHKCVELLNGLSREATILARSQTEETYGRRLVEAICK